MESFHHAPFRLVHWVPSSTMTNVSASPPLIPDGRISPDKAGLAAMVFPSRTFPFEPKLKCLPTYAPCLNGLISNSTFLFVRTIYTALYLVSDSFKCPPFTESPYARSSCYLLQCCVYAQHQRALPLLHSSYGLKRQSKTLPPPSVVPIAVGPCHAAA